MREKTHIHTHREREGERGTCISRRCLFACSYKKLAVDVKVGQQILCADGSIVLEVLETNPAAGTVRAKCLNNATLGCATTTRSKLPLTLQGSNKKGSTWIVRYLNCKVPV
jgi:pyruvate kinase